MKFKVVFTNQEAPDRNWTNIFTEDKLWQSVGNSKMAEEIVRWAKISELLFKITVVVDLQTWEIERIIES